MHMVTTISKFEGYRERIVKAAGEAGGLGEICAVAHVLMTHIRQQNGGNACTHIMVALAVAAAAYHPEADTDKNPVTAERTAKAQAEAALLFDSMVETLSKAYDEEPIAKGSEGDVMIDGKLGSEWTGEERCLRHIDEHVKNLAEALKGMIPACTLLAIISMGEGGGSELLKVMAADRERVAAKLREEQATGESAQAEPPAPEALAVEPTPPDAPAAPVEEPPAPAAEEPTAST